MSSGKTESQQDHLLWQINLQACKQIIASRGWLELMFHHCLPFGGLNSADSRKTLPLILLLFENLFR